MGRLWLGMAQLALPCCTCCAVSHLPQLDPLAVSVFVIKCLSQLRCPLLGMKMQLPDGGSVLVRDELLDAAMSGYSEDVRASMVEHVLASMPPMQAAALQVGGGLLRGDLRHMRTMAKRQLGWQIPTLRLPAHAASGLQTAVLRPWRPAAAAGDVPGAPGPARGQLLS